MLLLSLNSLGQRAFMCARKLNCNVDLALFTFKSYFLIHIPYLCALINEKAELYSENWCRLDTFTVYGSNT
jgi:hypothetical protein